MYHPTALNLSLTGSKLWVSLTRSVGYTVEKGTGQILKRKQRDLIRFGNDCRSPLPPRDHNAVAVI